MYFKVLETKRNQLKEVFSKIREEKSFGEIEFLLGFPKIKFSDKEEDVILDLATNAVRRLGNALEEFETAFPYLEKELENIDILIKKYKEFEA